MMHDHAGALEKIKHKKKVWWVQIRVVKILGFILILTVTAFHVAHVELIRVHGNLQDML